MSSKKKKFEQQIQQNKINRVTNKMQSTIKKCPNQMRTT